MATLKWWDDLKLTEEEGKRLNLYLDWYEGRITPDQFIKLEKDLEFNNKFVSTINEDAITTQEKKSW